MMPRVKTINVNNASTGDWYFASGDIQYDGAGNIKAIGSDRYAYDLVSRLVQANENRAGSTSTTQSATYDAFGNLTSLLSNGIGPTMNVDASSNRLSSPTIEYDTWGNMSRWQSQFYQYDRLNRLKRFDNGTEHWIFAYAADDERAWIYRIGDGGYEMWTIRGVDGQVLREYRSNFLDGYRDYVRASGRVVAKVDRISATQGVVDETIHFATDHLGTIRVSTRQNGYLETAHHYFPYGQRINPNPTEDERLQFTGHERDTWLTSGFADDLDYMHARHYNPQLGRLLQVDPFPGLTGRPQSLNRYSYVVGNPMRYTDPWGLELSDGSCPPDCKCDDSGKVVSCKGDSIDVVGEAPWVPTDTVTLTPIDGEVIGPWGVGWEWLLGRGPRIRYFSDGDYFAELLRQHEHIQKLVDDIENCRISGEPGRRDYSLRGLAGVPKYLRDYSTLATGGATGNLAVTYLGSYSLSYSLSGESLSIHIENASTINSATHPPVIGYTAAWDRNIGTPLNRFFSTGPMSPTRQVFDLSQKVNRNCGGSGGW